MSTDTIHVLVVEDNPGDARLICEHLAEMGASKYDCACAARLSEAFDLMKRSIYHVMLLDLSLPDSQGFETFQRARDSGPDLPIVVLTGLDDKDLASRAVREGAQDYLLKGEIDGSNLDRVIRYSIERHKTRRELEILNATLEQRVAERTRELAEAYDSLDKAHRNLREMDRIKAAFIDVMSHELRTPLATILGALPILQKKAETDAPGLLAFLKAARSAARRLERLTYNALKVAEEGDYTRRLSLKFIGAEEIVLRALQEIQPFLELRCQQVRSVIPETPPQVLADANMIHDALTNLLMNAIKFTPDGGGITVSVRAVEQDGVEFRVGDTGIGVSEEDKPHLFEMLFASLDAEHHSSGEYEFQKRGMGMGLAMVKKFVEMHGGRVGFESEMGKGSEFYFVLPRA